MNLPLNMNVGIAQRNPSLQSGEHCLSQELGNTDSVTGPLIELVKLGANHGCLQRRQWKGVSRTVQ